ncbi:uncharacterized protein Z519_04891 [Cladophialophora bantiana CBS 173.52]|uniref:FAD/NAD(P)-binding domain-containing protein n=1 Tax=Cladophialophora bantiana (strain ATCC 10958 / CBS 173.52 / CDC B-1940 / NIH 8579) TaxID=1442370 RepID=A0A0D2G8G0_CLAB1|nr:uncharacterized protein Z519_04891 [Cladophialophora bantiana CBS 173.52]KIW94912.1 hypothetical protein Z519_04891 [Cladophialophora bantiana CBS 173.52]
MVGQASTAIPPNSPVPGGDQKTQVNAATPDRINGSHPHLARATAEAAVKIQQTYDEERQKRTRPDGDAQYIDLAISEQFKHYREDPWLDERSETVTIRNGEHVKYLILGAGCGGLLFAIKLIKAGITASEIRIVDAAGGVGGTWYYNRYPGLMCDIESYCYLPLLEEMEYIPKHKYAYGYEIREYLNAVADRYRLSDTAMFRTKINALVWDDPSCQWKVSMAKERKSGPPLEIEVTAQFVIAASGLLLHPKLPAVSGIENFKGASFHTSRWNYSVTGGSPDDPALDRLSGKRVGIIGTGATAIQAIPHLAKHAGHLVIFQRTPSSVDTRGQHPTDKDTWTSVASHPGWWKERNLNLAAHLSGATRPADVNLVNDQWSRCRSYRGLVGGPDPPYSVEEIPAFLASLHALDMPRAERLRQRVDEIVEDKKTAQALKHWYSSWCKRPTFHDDYLPCFNLPNVELANTDGKGVDRLTATGAVVGDKEYPLDILIFSTGFRAPGIGSPAFRAGMKITGKNGKDMDAKWHEGVATLHGSMTHDFPNFFMPGPFQAGATGNQNFTHDIMSNHVAQIITQAQAKYPGQRVVIEPTVEAEEKWTGEILKRSMSFAGMAGCTPGYLNGEGIMDAMPMEVKMKAARMGIWGEGIESFMNTLEAWENDGKLEGLEVKPVK